MVFVEMGFAGLKTLVPETETRMRFWAESLFTSAEEPENTSSTPLLQ
jgi:hypothetical protein